MDRVLITGVTGFIGSHLAPALVDRSVEVHAIARDGAKLERLGALRDKITVHTVTQDVESVHAAVVTANPGVCFHLATHFIAQHTLDDVDALAEANIAFPMRVAESLTEVGRVRFVNVGTAWQHVESAAYRPKGLYAATKQAFDDVLASYAWSNQLEIVSLRLFDTYGPNDGRGKLVDALVRAAATGAPIDMGSGEQLIDLVHVDDVIAALLIATGVTVSPTAPPPRYAVSSGQPIRVHDLVDLVGRVCAGPVDARWGARPDRSDEMHTAWNAGPPLPGWTPQVALADGLGALARAG